TGFYVLKIAKAHRHSENKDRHLHGLEGCVMGKVLMLYASMTGNTEAMADIIGEAVEKHGHHVVTKTFEMDPVDVAELADYDGLLIGTYSEDDGELPFEVEDFYEE